MSDEKKKCSGCGREVTGDIGWCMSCRSILYTDLLIARTDFSGSQFKTLVFPARDIIWMQDRIRLREAELKAADDTNDMIAAELDRLRADLTEARADVARFEAALDVANRELAEAREKDAELASMRAELEQTKRDLRDHAEHINYYGALYSRTELERQKIDEQREFYKDELAKAQTCADEMAALAWKWKYKADCQRDTIRALVVAARAMWRFVVILHEKNGVPISHAVFGVRLQLWSKHMDDVIVKIGTEE